MATGWTTIWRLPELTPLDPGTNNSWGSILTAAQPLPEIGAVGIPAINIAGLTTYTLTVANGASDQARQSTYPFTGALTGTCTVTIPNIQRWGWARNQTTGGQNVVLTTGSGTTLTVPPSGQIIMWWCDGANNITAPPVGSGYQEIATYVLSSVAGQTLPLTGYSRYSVICQGLTVNTGTAQLQCQFSLNGGSSFINGSGQYTEFGYSLAGTALAPYNVANNNIALSQQMTTSSILDGTYEVCPGPTLTHLRGTANFFGSANSDWGTGQFAGICPTTGQVNAMQVFPSGGLFSGKVILLGLP